VIKVKSTKKADQARGKKWHWLIIILIQSDGIQLYLIAPLPHLLSISSMFYEQLLHAQIMQGQKKTDNLTVFFMLLGSARIKAASRTLIKLTPSLNYHRLR